MKVSLCCGLLLVRMSWFRYVLMEMKWFLVVSALAAFKRATFEDPFSVLSDWNSVDASPCNWTGVICSRNQDCVFIYLDVGGSNKSQGMTKGTGKQSTEGHKHQSPRQPEWLLILEVTTGVLVVVCIITGISAAVKSCKLKSSVKVTWKKTRHWKDVIPISIELQPPFVMSELSSNAVYLTEDYSPKATQYLQCPEEIGKLVDPELENVKSEDLTVLCSVVNLCIESDPTKRPSMQTVSAMLENGIDLSAAAILKESSLAWAELALGECKGYTKILLCTLHCLAKH
ncbi:hypothetical protein B296_00013665 [Ensete ventricosum]|uniref:Leucine-rich repeat-containing N-terminal plant-type domain-containing protein n=1 Tax=Ensete ventricosum TaxID=4639 RepID=A0A427B853_ENSVE|nr:hypothetical protein B296_00013665 [Ensete ventricosum]